MSFPAISGTPWDGGAIPVNDARRCAKHLCRGVTAAAENVPPRTGVGSRPPDAAAPGGIGRTLGESRVLGRFFIGGCIHHNGLRVKGVPSSGAFVAVVERVPAAMRLFFEGALHRSRLGVLRLVLAVTDASSAPAPVERGCR